MCCNTLVTLLLISSYPGNTGAGFLDWFKLQPNRPSVATKAEVPKSSGTNGIMKSVFQFLSNITANMSANETVADLLSSRFHVTLNPKHGQVETVASDINTNSVTTARNEKNTVSVESLSETTPLATDHRILTTEIPVEPELKSQDLERRALVLEGNFRDLKPPVEGPLITSEVKGSVTTSDLTPTSMGPVVEASDTTSTSEDSDEYIVLDFWTPI